MSTRRTSRGDVAVALNRLVRDGVISGFRTNLFSRAPSAQVEVTVATGANDVEEVRRVVVAVLENLIEDAAVAVER